MGWQRGRDRVPLLRLFAAMCEARAFEEALAELWRDGLVSGELHLGIGEEGAVVGVLDHLRDGDGVATDHRSTPPFVTRGCDLRALALEMLGHRDGLCHGQGGHMHLFDPDRLIASSGIVGASSCTACGFALAHQHGRTDNVAVAFFGEGAANQGMVLEALNLAAVWRLPVVFVCKNSGWAITTRSARLTAGSLVRRARSFDIPAAAVDGGRPWEVWHAASRAVSEARSGRGPWFLLVHVKRPRGHFEDDELVRTAGHPRQAVQATRDLVGPALGDEGGRAGERIRGLVEVTRTLGVAIGDRLTPEHDPLVATARRLPPDDAARVAETARRKVDEAVAAAVAATRASR